MQKNKIVTQTIYGDRVHLEAIPNNFEQPYKYLEIGVFKGGSLAPHLENDNCAKVMAVDLYPTSMRDERHLEVPNSIDFEWVKNNLTQNGYSIDKLSTFRGDIKNLPVDDKYDLCLIDGEHTNRAAFSDAVHCLRHMKANSLILFHDTTIVFGAIDCFGAYLDINEISYKRYKLKGSEITAFLLGNLRDIELYCHYNKSDYELFKIGAKLRLAEDVKKFRKDYENHLHR